MSRSRIAFWTVLVALLALLPPLATALQQPFYLDLIRKVMIFAIAAASLNLILGYGGYRQQPDRDGVGGWQGQHR